MEKIMNKSKSTSALLALAVALPNFITPVIAAQNTGATVMPIAEKRVAPMQKMEIKKAQPSELKKMQTKKAEPAELKKMLNKELARMTPAEKKQIGQARINQLKAISGDEIARGGCFTQGVGCQGTSGFTSGVLCCVIIKTGL